jgi:hypothetical protein
MRTRAKENLPHVLLTLLSIIQALALELLWTHLETAEYLFAGGWPRLIYWLEAVSMFLGILVIWLVYAANVMRFRWVPSIGDSVHPFVIGLLQFMMIELLGPDGIGWWMLLLAAIFGIMNWVAHSTMRRARHDGDNDEFFRNVPPATFRDFYPAATTVAGLAVFGLYLVLVPENLIVSALAMVGTTMLMLWQLYTVDFFWKRTMSLVDSGEDSGD